MIHRFYLIIVKQLKLPINSIQIILQLLNNYADCVNGTVD